MKKMIAMLVALMMTMLFVPAMAETADALVGIEGMVVEIREDGSYLIDNVEMGEVVVNVDEETYFETSRDIEAGDYLYIDYDGKMTRSLPAQITADVVRMFALSGQITAVDAENGFVMMNTEEHGEVQVNLPEGYDASFIDFEAMTVYHNGAMTMSLPAQIGAGMILPHYALQGEVGAIEDGYFMLTVEDQEYQVNIEPELIPETLKSGDIVRVIFNGQMTRSLPAQITAMELIQISR